MNILPGVREIFSKDVTPSVGAGRHSKEVLEKGRISQGQVVQVHTGGYSCIVVLDGGLLIQGDQ